MGAASLKHRLVRATSFVFFSFFRPNGGGIIEALLRAYHYRACP